MTLVAHAVDGEPLAYRIHGAHLRVATASARRRCVLRGVASQRVVAAPMLALLRSRAGMRIARELGYISGGAHRDTCPAEVSRARGERAADAGCSAFHAVGARSPIASSV